MTTYTMTGETRSGRPVYKSSYDYYLFYYQSGDSWYVSTRLRNDYVYMYVDDTSNYAEDISGTWYLVDGTNSFRPNSLVRVTCVSGGLSGGAIAGIVIGVLAGVCLLVVVPVTICLCKKSGAVSPA
ncbi:uncharacterized protein LOC118416816 [Branchiostoma floridae]|nr:uncharacterized protein LOC118416816 [Branchiostoma floridae]